MKVLVLAEHLDNELKTTTFSAISAASGLSDTVDVLIAGYQLSEVVARLSKIQTVEKVCVADNEQLAYQLAENMSQLVAKYAENYDAVIAPHTTFGKNLLPRVAALLDMPMLSDVTEIIDQEHYLRPIYAGNAMAQMKLTAAKKLLTIRPTVFEPAPLLDDQQATVENIEFNQASLHSAFIKLAQSDHSRPELGTAKVVVSGGRALKSKENFALLEQLADKLNAAVGASRAAVDAGYVPNDYQVGQTGKVVAPDLYIAVGISGAIQHVAGIKDSKVIVAINKDQDAPIFEVADYGLVGDLFDIIPEMIKQL